MKYFSYGPLSGDIEFHLTPEQAKTAAEEYISEYCDDDTGWDESVERVCWGKVYQIARKENIRKIDDNSYYCDYNLRGVGKVLVINSYDDKYQYSSNVAKLLANDEIKRKFQEVIKIINSAKDPLIIELQNCFSSKKNSNCIEKMVSDILPYQTEDIEADFFDAIMFLKDKITNGLDDFSYLADIQYDILFNEKTESLFKDDNFMKKLSDFSGIYKKLIENSLFFRHGVLDHNNAQKVISSIKDSNFDESLGNRIFLNGRFKIYSDEELEKLIKEDKNRILDDENLKKSFSKINKDLEKNSQTMEFASCIKNNLFLIEKLERIPRLKYDLWVSYLLKNKNTYLTLVKTYEQKRIELNKIKG